MPCGDGPPLGPWEGGYESYQATLDEERAVKQMLCGLCRRIEECESMDLTNLIEADAKLVAWWASHKIEDAKRLAAEKADERRKMIKREALKKLTKEEREALGLRD